MNLFSNIFDQFTGKQAQPQVPSFATPQAPRTTNYTQPIVAPAKRISTGFAPGYEGTVDTSKNLFNRMMTPIETGVKSVSQNIQKGGQQLSDISMQHAQNATDRGYNQGYIDLGQKIKAKHPQYGDISDEELGRKIVAKYPQYQDIVDAGSGIMSNPISGSLASVESGISKGLGTMFQGISDIGSAPLQDTGTAGITRFAKGALETGLGSVQTATSIMPTAMGAKALVAPTVNTLFSTDTAGKVLQPISEGIGTGIGMGQSALGYDPNSSVSKDIQGIGSTAGTIALLGGAQKGASKAYDVASPYVKPLVRGGVNAIKNIPNPVSGAKNVLTREIPVGIMERDLSLTPTERANIETINGKPAGAVALEYNLPKDKQAMADTLSVKADEAYNGITSDLKNITTRSASAPAKEMLGIMLDEMGNSPILVRTMKPYMEKLQQMMEQSDYSLAEKNAIRRDFDRIVANKIFDSKGRVSGIEDKAIANIREGLSTELQNEAMQYGIDIKSKNNILRTSISLRDGVLRRLSQENKNNKIGLQDIGVGAIFGAGDPLTTASVIFGKKLLENSAPGIAQRLYNSNKTPYATSNLKRGVTISPRDTTNGLSIAPDNVPTVRIPVKKQSETLALPSPSGKPLSANVVNVKPIVMSKKLSTGISESAKIRDPRVQARNDYLELKSLEDSLTKGDEVAKSKARTALNRKIEQMKVDFVNRKSDRINQAKYDKAYKAEQKQNERDRIDARYSENQYGDPLTKAFLDLRRLNERHSNGGVDLIEYNSQKSAIRKRFVDNGNDYLYRTNEGSTTNKTIEDLYEEMNSKGGKLSISLKKKPKPLSNESKVNKPTTGDTIPEGYFKNAFGEIIKKPSNAKGGFIKSPFAKEVVPKDLLEEVKTVYDGSYENLSEGKELLRGGDEKGRFWTDNEDIAKSFDDFGKLATKKIAFKNPLDVRSPKMQEFLRKNIVGIDFDSAINPYRRNIGEFNKLVKWAEDNGFDGIIGKTSDDGQNFLGNEFIPTKLNEFYSSKPKPLRK